jgi:hypothetical protein
VKIGILRLEFGGILLPLGGATVTEPLRKAPGRRAGLTLVVALALAAGACGETPTSPCCGPPAVRPPGLVVTGVVSGDGQPLVNATVYVQAAAGILVPWKTDGAGRFRVEIANDPGVFLWASDDRFAFQPCATWIEPSGSSPQERTADVYLASASGASSVGNQTVAGRRRVSGTVRTMTATGPQPVSSASVTSRLPGSNEEWIAWTSTDTAGRFSLCGLPIDQRFFIYSETYSEFEQSAGWASASVEPGGGDANLELILSN